MVHMYRSLTWLTCLSLGLLPAASRAGEWPQFRGPNGAGVSAETQLPVTWAADKNVRWKFKDPGLAWSSPVVWGDKVFVTTAISDKQTKPKPGDYGFGPMGGGPGGFGGPPQPGQILPPFLQEILKLTAEQKKQLHGAEKGTFIFFSRLWKDGK